MKLEDANILFASTLLRLDKPCGSSDADDETASDLGIESAGVAGLLDLENSLDPSDNLVRGRIRWLVYVQNTGLDVVFDVSLIEGDNYRKKTSANLERTATLWVRSEVIGAHIELVPSFEQERPVVRILFDLLLAGLQAEISRALDLSEIRHFRPSDVLEKSTEKPLSQ